MFGLSRGVRVVFHQHLDPSIKNNVEVDSRVAFKVDELASSGELKVDLLADEHDVRWLDLLVLYLVVEELGVLDVLVDQVQVI